MEKERRRTGESREVEEKAVQEEGDKESSWRKAEEEEEGKKRREVGEEFISMNYLNYVCLRS